MIYEHVFSEESKKSLMEFINSCKNLKDYHDPKEEERARWKPFMKNLSLIEISDENNKSASVIKTSGCETEYNETIQHSIPHSDIKDGIPEEEEMLELYVEALQDQPEARIQETYRNALSLINLAGLIKMGESIIKLNSNNIIVKCYCKELLFQMMSQMFREDLKKFFQDFCHYNSYVIKQLAHFLQVHDELEIFILYIDSKSTLEDQILREFLITYEEPFLRKYILVLDNLIHKGTEYNSIKMVIDILSSHAVEYKEDKEYGKLLLKIIEVLGPKTPLKSQIDWILSVHISKWKIKLKKLHTKYSEGM